MTVVPRISIGKVSYSIGDGRTALRELATAAAEKIGDVGEVGAVVAATFSSDERFPSLAVRIASHLGLSPRTPAFDMQMACSAYPYALYLAGRIAADMGKSVLVVSGDAQTRLVDPSDHATGGIFSDAATCTLVSSKGEGESRFDFLSRCDEALLCPEDGPIRMDGMKVFTFVATEVSAFLKAFISGPGPSPELFVPHQANPYMVRQLAKSIGYADRFLAIDESLKNPGGCSIPLAIAKARESGALAAGCENALVAGFGAGFSAGAGLVSIAPA